MKPKPNNTEEHSASMAAEPVAVYGRDGHTDMNASVGNMGRMTVDEYFDAVRSVLHRKYENLQG